jgi:hypothetical protein
MGDGDREPVFYYSREHRLRRASPELLALNDGKAVRPSLRKTLFANKGNVLVFITIVVFSILGMATSFMGREPKLKLGGNTIALTVVREEGVLIMEIVKSFPDTGEAYIGEVAIAVSPVISKSQAVEDVNLFTHRVIFHSVDSESFFISLPFDENNLMVILRTNNDEQKAVKIKVKKTK